MSQVTARKTNINHQVNEIYISFMKAVIMMRKGTRRQLELPDELVVASWPVLAWPVTKVTLRMKVKTNKLKSPTRSSLRPK